MANRNWKYAVDKVLSSEGRRRSDSSRRDAMSSHISRASMRPEWGRFSEEQLELLFNLQASLEVSG